MTKITGTTLAIYTVAASTRNATATAEQEVTAHKVAGLAAEVITDRSILSPLFFKRADRGPNWFECFDIPVRQAALSDCCTHTSVPQ